MVHYVLAFLTSIFYVGLKSLQQLNVVHRQYRWIVPVSVFMALCEVYIVSQQAKNGIGWLAVVFGLGAGLGSMGATWLHNRLLNKTGKE